MSGLATIRRRKSIWGRHVLGTFAIAWLSVAMQPCAMAMDVETTDPCPHCPPVEILDEAPCDVKISPDCAADGQIVTEARSGQLKLKDKPSDLPPAVAPVLYESEKLAHVAQAFFDPLVRLNPSGPPLNILYCVYLK